MVLYTFQLSSSIVSRAEISPLKIQSCITDQRQVMRSRTLYVPPLQLVPQARQCFCFTFVSGNPRQADITVFERKLRGEARGRGVGEGLGQLELDLLRVSRPELPLNTHDCSLMTRRGGPLVDIGFEIEHPEGTNFDMFISQKKKKKDKDKDKCI